MAEIISENKLIMLQPFKREIQDGEISLIYLKDRLSHAVIRYPGVVSDKKRSKELEYIPYDLKIIGEKISAAISFGESLYSRIDLIITEKGPEVIEIEQNEPDLFFRKIKEQEKATNLFWELTVSYLKE